MMINKRLIGTVSESKKYVADFTVVLPCSKYRYDDKHYLPSARSVPKNCEHEKYSNNRSCHSHCGNYSVYLYDGSFTNGISGL